MERVEELISLFLGKNEIPKYIMGTNTYAKLVYQYLGELEIRGFINEYESIANFCNTPVINDLNGIDKNAIVLSCVVEASPVSARRKLDEAGIRNIDYYSFVKYSGLPISIPYWRDFPESYRDRQSEYELIFRLLADEESKRFFSDLIEFRLNYNLSAMDRYSKRMKEQYFEPFLGLKDTGEVFCDIGGYDGDTTIEFVKRYPNYGKVYFFEPEPKLMEKAKKNLSEFQRIEYCQYAASNNQQTLHFKSNGSSSSVSDSGDIEVKADKIDNIICTPVSYIKMDIEGSESMAIDGARHTILKYHPKLAICVYHKGADFIDIPKQILEIRKDYNIYMRHYTEGYVETVMYFVPSVI